MKQHWHRNDKTLVLNGVVYFGLRESKNMYVGMNGTFITQSKIDGTYRGAVRGGSRVNYYRVHPSKGKDDYAHRIVYEVFSNSEIRDGLEIDHINGNSLDNRFENLRVVTHVENANNPITKKRNVSACSLRRRNDQWRKNNAESKKRFYETEKGRALKEKISQERKGVKASQERAVRLVENGRRQSTPIVGVFMKTGEVRRFESQKDAARSLGIFSSHINNVLRGRAIQTFGWKFRYEDEKGHEKK